MQNKEKELVEMEIDNCRKNIEFYRDEIFLGELMCIFPKEICSFY